jgi:signal transduction histidine kinase
MVDIARRNQALLGRTLGYISDLERDERDTSNLEHLFRLDHLATRMRRNAQSLLVLSGTEPSRQQSEPVPMGDVVRAALSEIEHYTQVDVGDVGSVRVLGTAAADLSHLLAELLENATTFSPPTTPVTVIGRAVADGHQLAVYDQGIGMTAEEIVAANALLSSPSSPVTGHGRRLGFQVVARLAERHGIRVSLAATPGGSGLTVIVRIPAELIEREVGALTYQPFERRVPTLPLTPNPIDVSAPVVPLVKRVPGASVPTTESAALPRLPDRPTPDQIRSSLSGLQRGVALARDEDLQ